MTEKREELLAKIRALLSKTMEAGCTESEAMSALGKARAMMDVHDVSDEELRLTKEEKATAKVYEQQDPHGVKRGLAYAVQKFTGTLTWIRGKEERTICGLPADIEFAEWLLEALDEFVKCEFVQFAMTSATGDGNERRTAMRNFINACTGRISERLIELAQPPKAQTANARALVVTKEAAIKEYMDACGIKLGTARPSTINVKDVAAYEAGRTAGERASFGRPVEGKAAVPRIGKR